MQPADDAPCEHSPRAWRLRAALLALWAAGSFGVAFFARELDQAVGGWSLNFWLLAQGSVLMFIGIAAVYAWAMNRAGRASAQDGGQGDER
jgi:putative solute:sodium symporter small subunit